MTNHHSTIGNEFKHHTSIGPNGEILYDAPIVIRDENDLNDYRITIQTCRLLPFQNRNYIGIYYFKTENRALAEYLWDDLNIQHSREYAETRCIIPGRRKPFIICPCKNKCIDCPYQFNTYRPFVNFSDFVPPDDDIDEDEFADMNEPSDKSCVEEQCIAKMEYQEIKAIMDAEDPRIAVALEMRFVQGISVEEISMKFKVSPPRVYQFFTRAREIGKEYRSKIK